MKIDILGSIFMMIQDIFAGVLRLIELGWLLVADNWLELGVMMAFVFLIGLVSVAWEELLKWRERSQSTPDPRRVRNPRL